MEATVALAAAPAGKAVLATVGEVRDPGSLPGGAGHGADAPVTPEGKRVRA